MEDVRRVREAVRPVELAPLEQLAEELEQLPAGVLPGEVRVALREAGLGEPRHRRRPREGLGEEDHVRVLTAHLPDQPLPERQRLRVRVVDAEDGDAATDPVQDDVEQRLPEAAPVLAPEVDVVDVLVALRRVLCVLQRPVGAAVEPLGMLLQPRVVGRALDRKVERDLDPELLRVGDEGAELLLGAERRVDRVVPALLGADRPGAADVALRRRLGVVPALAVRVPDRVDRRQVEDVEAELGEARQELADAGEAAPRAREELVPRAEAARARGRRPPSTSPTTPSRIACLPARRAPSRRSAPRRRAAPLPPTARWRGRPGPRRPCAAAPPGTRRRGRPTPRSGSSRAPAGRPRTSRPRRRCRAVRAATRSSGWRPGPCGEPPRRASRGRRERSGR